MTTMKDVAQAAGVSVMTVSRAFKAESSISTKKRDLILRMADEMDYVFDSTASSLRAQKTGFVAVTIPSLNNSNFADTVRALSDSLAQSGRQVLLGFTNYDVHEEEKLIEQLLRRRPEAIVVTGGRHTDKARRLLEGAGIPVVETWDLPENPIGSVVGFSNAQAVHQLVGHLTDTGRRKIAFIGGDTTDDARGADRRQGFIDAMTKAGLGTDLLMGAGTPPISMREGAAAMGTLLDNHADCDAVICVSDLSAFGALCECTRRGVNIPEDIAIAGFGAYEVADICVPPLTTIDPFAAQIGEAAGELICELLENNAAPITTIRHLKPKLRIAPSTLLG